MGPIFRVRWIKQIVLAIHTLRLNVQFSGVLPVMEPEHARQLAFIPKSTNIWTGFMRQLNNKIDIIQIY